MALYSFKSAWTIQTDKLLVVDAVETQTYKQFFYFVTQQNRRHLDDHFPHFSFGHSGGQSCL